MDLGKMDKKQGGIIGLSFLFFVVWILGIVEVYYSYGSAYWALLSCIGLLVLLGNLGLKDQVRKVVGGFGILAGLLAFGATIAAIVAATGPNVSDLGLGGKPVLCLLVAGLCFYIGYFNFKVQEESRVTVSGLDDVKGVDDDNKCIVCCKSFGNVLFFILVLFASFHTILLVSEQNKFYPGDDNFYEVDGHMMFARCTNVDSSGPLIFFEHGLGGNSLDWTWAQRGITAAGYKTCSFDRAGYGRSFERGPGPRTSPQLAKEAKLLLDKIGIVYDSIIYVGHSFSGFNMRIFNQQNPGLIEGFVMVDPVNPNNTKACDPEETYSDGLYRTGLLLAETGILRLFDLFNFLDGFAPISELPDDVQREYYANLMRIGYFKTRLDEWAPWGKSCTAVKNLQGNEKILNVPLKVIVPTRGIHSNDLKYGREMYELSPHPNSTYLEIDSEDADHVTVMFAKKYAQLTIDAILDILEVNSGNL